jgi:glycosyltransferase involved in cell wall biosynthesis
MHVREIYAGAASGVAARAWPLWRRHLMQADARICVSASVAEQFDDAVVVHDGVPQNQGLTDRRQGDSFSVAVLGRIADWKGQDVLVRALAEPELAAIGAVGVIAGDAYPGEVAPDIAALAARLGVANRVRLLGFVSDPRPVLASVDVVAVPSTRPDPLPNSALEALAAGVPVVAAAHGGLPEIVRDGATGLLVAPGDHVALARALRRLADDPAERRRMGEAAAADAHARFGIDRMLDEVEAVYRSLGVTRS